MTTDQAIKETDTVTKRIGKPQVVKALKEVVRENPDGNNQDRCVYTQAGEPHCIVAKAIVRLGLDITPLEGLSDGANQDLLVYGEAFTPAAIEFFEEVQAHADGRSDLSVDTSTPWVDALVYAGIPLTGIKV